MKIESREDLANEIKRAIYERGLNVNRIADEIGNDRSNLWTAINKSNMTFGKLQRIVEAIGGELHIEIR